MPKLTIPLALAGASILFASAQPAAAQLSWATRQLDFNPGLSDQSVTGNFEFTNVGQVPVTIMDVKSTCGCTTTALEKKTYGPGETGRITTTFHIGDRTGFQQKQVAVTTDFKDEPYVQLTIRAKIPELVRIEPKALTWPLKGQTDTRVIRLATAIDQPIRVLGVRASDDRVFAQLKQVEPGKLYEIAVTVQSTADPFRASLRIDTDYPPDRPKVFTIPADVSAPFQPQATGGVTQGYAQPTSGGSTQGSGGFPQPGMIQQTGAPNASATAPGFPPQANVPPASASIPPRPQAYSFPAAGASQAPQSYTPPQGAPITPGAAPASSANQPVRQPFPPIGNGALPPPSAPLPPIPASSARAGQGAQ